MTDTADRQTVIWTWLDTLYPDVTTGWLTVCHRAPSGSIATGWYEAGAWDEASAHAAELFGTDVWFGVGLRHERGERGRGGNADVACLPGLWIDIDTADGHHATNGALPADPDQALQLAGEFPLPPTAIISTGGGLHAWWLHPTPIPPDPDLLDRWGAWWKHTAAGRGWTIDPVWDPARIMRLPATLNHKHTPPRAVDLLEVHPGRRYSAGELAAHLELDEPAPPAVAASSVVRIVGPAEPAEKIPGDIPAPERPGDRYNRTADPGQLLTDTGWTLHHTDHAGARHYTRPGPPPKGTTGATIYPDRHVAIWTTNAPPLEARTYTPFGLYTALHHRGDHAAAAAELARQYRGEDRRPPMMRTELGNARRYVATYGHKFRWVPQWKTWLVWTGQRWARDIDGAAERAMKRVADQLLLDALSTDGDERKACLQWALASQKANTVRNALALASTEPGVPIQPDQLDADPWALNVENGTINLRTGELHPHNPARLITRLAPVTYIPDARCARWEAFLASATRDDHELITFLQRAAGYTLTGETSEEVLFFIHGPTQAGKSTFAEALTSTIGDYHRRTDFDTFLTRADDRGPRTDIARLVGARLVISNEIEDGKRIAEGLVKSLTGGDTITARFLYQAEFEYRPAFKLWLVANHAPKVRHGDTAIWRRILRIPFEHTVTDTERDDTLKTYLTRDPAARSAILAWAVSGCLAWQHDGLAVPATVHDATNAYRADQDPIGDFLADRCHLHADTWALAKELRREYDEWADENGVSTRARLSARAFAQVLEERGCRSSRRRIAGQTQRVWDGIGLLDIITLNTREARHANLLNDDNEITEEATGEPPATRATPRHEDGEPRENGGTIGGTL